MASDSRRESRPGDDTADGPPASLSTAAASEPLPSQSRAAPQTAASEKSSSSRPSLDSTDRPRSPTPSSVEGTLSPDATDRVFPIRSVVSIDPTPTSFRGAGPEGGYFPSVAAHARRESGASEEGSEVQTPLRTRQASGTRKTSPKGCDERERRSRRSSTASNIESTIRSQRTPPQYLQGITAGDDSIEDDGSRPPSGHRGSASAPSPRDAKGEEAPALVTARFQHVVTDGGHAIITGRGGEVLQRCEDEPIHIPGAVQGFGLLIALEEQSEGRLIVRVVSENSKQMIGYTPTQLFVLDSFTDILSEEQADNLLDHVDFIRDEDADIVTNGPEVFTMTIRNPQRKNQKFWCAVHINNAHPHLIICEFELEDDPVNPLVPPNESTPEPPEDTLNSQSTEEELQASTQPSSKPLRVLRSARKRKGEAAAMEVFNILSQVQEQLAAATNLENFLKILVGVVKDLTGFHRVMMYQFDQNWNGRVVTELVDPRATKDLYKGLNFPASDIPKQARDLYKINKVRMLYDRDQETARLVCRTVEDLETPVDLTYSYLRAMSPIHLKYLANMAVRSSMSISINAFEELWGLIACHSYGPRGMRVSFPIRKMCRLVGDSASRNIERLSYASRLQARKLINTIPTQNNPSGYIIASSDDLLKLFDADFGLLSIRGETKILGDLEESQEALAMLEYLRLRKITSVITTLDIREDFPDLRYPPGFSIIAGLLLVPLSVTGEDFIVFFRKGQLQEVKWAGNPYEKFIREGTEGYLEPRKSFRTWSERVGGKSREWTEQEIETAAVLCLVYGKFIAVWRAKEAALQNSQLTRLLLANSAHEVRTPLNAIINYLEIALEGQLDQETRENLAKSHSASKSLVYVINDLLDLTKTEEGGDLVKGEVFDVKATLIEATDLFKGDARRKGLEYEIIDLPGLPGFVIGDQRRVRQAISNLTANAIQHSNEGGVRVEMYLTSREERKCEIEISVTDTGVGINSKKLDQLFRELEQVQTQAEISLDEDLFSDSKALPPPSKKEDGKTLGLGLAVVARIIRNMNGQLRLKSEEGKGSRFVIQFPFDLPDTELKHPTLEGASTARPLTAQGEMSFGPSTPPIEGEVTLIERGSANRRGSADFRPKFGYNSRMNSADSVSSKHSNRSGRSNRSFSSAHSGKSEADRLIEAIQEPHRVEGWHENGAQRPTSGKHIGGASTPRSSLERKRTHSASVGESPLSPNNLRRSESVKLENEGTIQAAHHAESSHLPRLEHKLEGPKPGESMVTDQGQPIRPVRVPEDSLVSSGLEEISALPLVTAESSQPSPIETPMSIRSPGPGSSERMRVLVAEDDPLNSRIIKKRLEKLGHEVFLTVNGEECASVQCDRRGFFDIVLMDMQMPIVDGLTSTKMIRSFEKTHPDHGLSTRAEMNRKVPIIAVSASLVEKERQTYIDAGLDGWILKPISFSRLSEIMEGVVVAQTRRDNLYQPGKWEHGGWFDEAKKDVFAADTTPSGEPPTSVRIAASSEGSFIKEKSESQQGSGQAAAEQAQEPQTMLSVPELGRSSSSEETITTADPGASS